MSMYAVKGPSFVLLSQRKLQRLQRYLYYLTDTDLGKSSVHLDT